MTRGLTHSITTIAGSDSRQGVKMGGVVSDPHDPNVGRAVKNLVWTAVSISALVVGLLLFLILAVLFHLRLTVG